MTPEMYTIIAVGVSTVGLLSGLMIFLFNQTNRRIDDLVARLDRVEVRIDWLEESLTQRLDRLEDKLDRLQEQFHSLNIRVSKLEWMLDAALYGKPVTFPPPPEPDADN